MRKTRKRQLHQAAQVGVILCLWGLAMAEGQWHGASSPDCLDAYAGWKLWADAGMLAIAKGEPTRITEAAQE